MNVGQEHPPASIGEITEGVEDLEMEHANTKCGDGGCSKKDCCRKEQTPNEGPTAEKTPCQSTTQPSFRVEESVDQLLKRCTDLVVELGIPEELVCHLQQLRNV